jgi:hypothetical protein
MNEIKEFHLVKGITSGQKLIVETKQVIIFFFCSSLSHSLAFLFLIFTVKKWVFSKIEELEQLCSVFRHVHAQRNNPKELLILNRPIAEMLGALKYPKENERFHKVFQVPQEECLVACTMIHSLSHPITFKFNMKNSILEYPFLQTISLFSQV